MESRKGSKMEKEDFVRYVENLQIDLGRPQIQQLYDMMNRSGSDKSRKHSEDKLNTRDSSDKKVD